MTGLEFLAGAVVTILVEVIRRFFKANRLVTYIILLVVSVIAAVIYVFYQDTIYWQTGLTILATAAAIHNLILRRITELLK